MIYFVSEYKEITCMLGPPLCSAIWELGFILQQVSPESIFIMASRFFTKWKLIKSLRLISGDQRRITVKDLRQLVVPTRSLLPSAQSQNQPFYPVAGADDEAPLIPGPSQEDDLWLLDYIWDGEEYHAPVGYKNENNILSTFLENVLCPDFQCSLCYMDL